MKLFALYSVYNGEELLKKSIEAIRPYVDGVVISVQEVSHYGEKNEGIKDYVNSIEGVDVIDFEPDLSKSPHENQIAKLQQRIDYARSKGATHYIGMACDHFYTPEDMEEGKEIAKDFDVTVSSLYTYYKDPTYRISPPERYYVPFITAIYENTKVVTKPYPVLVDPCVRVNTRGRFYKLEEDEVMLHHYSMVRGDIEQKLRNAAAKKNFEHKIDEIVNEYKKAEPGMILDHYYPGHRIIETKNIFNL